MTDIATLNEDYRKLWPLLRRDAWQAFRGVDALAFSCGFGLFGYWAVGELEIVRIAWGFVQLSRVAKHYGLQVCGLPIWTWAI